MKGLNPTGRKRRTSLTKLQRQTAAGAELISLCQTITEDGHLTDEEIGALRQWIDDNASAGLPAQEFLLATVSRIIEDGKVTEEERSELYRAIETVLPPEIREIVRGYRESAENAATEIARSNRESEQQLYREAKERARPLRSWNFMVAGSRYDGRPEVVKRFAVVGERTYLARDPENRFSRNAVEVRLRNGAQVGYVPERIAVEMAPLLDEGLPHTAILTKVLTGGRSPIPVVQTSVFRADATVNDLSFKRDIPAKVMHASQVGRGGCLSIIALSAVACLTALIVLVQE